jgi:hypothetical protein
MFTRRNVFVILAVGILVLVAVALYLRSDTYCNRDPSCRKLFRLEQLVLLYYIETGAIPSAVNDLFVLNEGGKYSRVHAADLVDPWAHPIQFTRDPNSRMSFRLSIRPPGEQSKEIVREFRR